MKKNISLVEDNHDLRELITFLLEEENFNVIAYANATDFINNYLEKPSDIFILDIQLPDGNGIDLCKLIKDTQQTTALPVILMSAHMNAKQLAGMCAVDAFIEKPFDINHFVITIKDHLN